MASKKFDNIGGVVLKRIEDGKRYLSAPRGETNKYEIVSRGDTIFEIDINEKKINTCTVKYKVRERGGMISMRYCDANSNRDFKPTHDTFYGRGIPANMKRCDVMYNKSVYGLVCTNMEDALKRLKSINEGNYFGALKRNDVIYLVNKDTEAVEEATVRSISYNNDFYNDGKHFTINTNLCSIYCQYSEYEENVSRFSDGSFYICHDDGIYDEKKVSIHMKKATADKVLREYLNSRKNVEKKKAETPEIPAGTPIRHTDNKGKELHYGDVVSYVRRNGLHGHTDISFGIIVGDSEKKIKVLDEEEARVGKKVVDWWRNNRGGFEESKGIHILEQVNVLRIKEAVKA